MADERLYLFSILTALDSGRQLTIGSYGLGKTTLLQAVLSTIYSLPVELYRAAQLRGHPEQTDEKMIGRPDLSALNQGKERVIWSLFSLVPGKIVDEINRLPEGKQNELLDAVDTGTFQYLNEVLFQPDQPFFATMNYPDAGNTELIPPMRDRFDVCVEMTPSPFSSTIVTKKNEEEKKRLSDVESYKKSRENFTGRFTLQRKDEDAR